MNQINVNIKIKQMKRALLINGHEPYAFAEGRYNQTMFEEIENQLKNDFQITKTIIKDGYVAEVEQEKFKDADVIVFQFPSYWFSVPALMKEYIDRVYAYGVFFGMGKEGAKYGHSNGLMNGKKYMFSITANSPEYAYNSNESDSFFEGKSLDETLFHIHKTNQFCGMEPLESFGAFDVIKAPQVDKDLIRLKEHMQKIIAQLN